MAGAENLDLNINFRAQTLEAEKVLRRLANASGQALSESLNKALNDTRKRLDEIRDKKLKWDRAESKWTRSSDATWDPIKKAWIYPDIDEATTTAKIKEQEVLFQKLSKAKLERAREQARKDLRHGVVETIGALGTANIFFKNLIQPAIDYEKSLTNVAKVYNLTKEATDAFGDRLMKLSQEMPVPIKRLGELSYQMSQLGIKEGKLDDAVRLAVKAGMGLDIPFEDVGERIGTLKAAYGMDDDLKELKNVLDFINEASNKVAAKPAEILNALTRVSPLTSSIGLKAEQAAALAATLLGAGWEPEQVETGIKDFIAGLRTMFEAKSGDSSRYRAVHQLGLDKGIFERAYKDDPIKAINLFFEAIQRKKESGADVDVLMLKIFGQHHFTKLLTYAGEAGKKKREELMGIYEKKTYLGSLEKEYRRVADTTASAWTLMKNNFDALKIAIGTTLLPTLKTAVTFISNMTKSLTEFIKNHSELTKFIATFGAIAGTITAAGMALRGIHTILSSLSILGVSAGKFGVFTLYVAGVIALSEALSDLNHNLAISASLLGGIMGAGAVVKKYGITGIVTSPRKFIRDLLVYTTAGTVGGGLAGGVGELITSGSKSEPKKEKEEFAVKETKVDNREKDTYNNTQTYYDNRLFNVNINSSEDFQNFLDIAQQNRPKGYD